MYINCTFVLLMLLLIIITFVECHEAKHICVTLKSVFFVCLLFCAFCDFMKITGCKYSKSHTILVLSKPKLMAPK